MSFVRPEARRALWRWREAIIAVAVLLLGAYWAFGTGQLLHWVGYLVLLLGFVLLFTGIQRARFRAGRGGPGVVQVDEGAVAYFGPLSGGVVALREMSSLSLDPTGTPPHWILSQPGQADIYVPLNAEGADALFDAFASLPGIRTEFMLAQMRRAGNQKVVIWRRQQAEEVGKLHPPGQNQKL